MIVPSNHTRIGAWVNSKMSGRNPPVICTNPLIAMQGYQTKTEDTISSDYNSICYITSRIGLVSIKGFSSIDVDVILEDYSSTAFLSYIITTCLIMYCAVIVSICLVAWHGD